MNPEELKTIVDQVTAAMAPRPTPPTPPAAPMMPLSAMVMPPAGNMAIPQAAPIGVSIGLEIPTPDGGTVSAHLQFGPEAVGNLPAIVSSLLQQGWPVRVYRPKAAWGQGGNGWGNRGGYGRRW